MGRKGDELKKKKRKNRTRYIHSCLILSLPRYYANGLICKHLQMLLHAIRHYETKGESASFVRKRTNPEWIERVTWPSSSICKWRETVRCAARIQYCIKLWQLLPRYNHDLIDDFDHRRDVISPLPLFKVILKMSRIVINWKIYYVYEVMSVISKLRFCSVLYIPLKSGYPFLQFERNSVEKAPLECAVNSCDFF